MTRVAVISVRQISNLVWWVVKRYEINNPFMGWARDNGTFTAGFDAASEFGEASVFLYPEGVVAWAQEWGWYIGSVMTDAMVDVAVVALHVTPGMLGWQIKRVAVGQPFLGWVQENGTFTAGINPMPEGLNAVLFRTAEYATNWAQAQGWNVVSVIKR